MPSQNTPHEPGFDSSGVLSWATCSCGWASAAYLDPIKTQTAWAVHEQEVRTDAA